MFFCFSFFGGVHWRLSLLKLIFVFFFFCFCFFFFFPKLLFGVSGVFEDSKLLGKILPCTKRVSTFDQGYILNLDLR